MACGAPNSDVTTDHDSENKKIKKVIHVRTTCSLLYQILKNNEQIKEISPEYTNSVMFYINTEGGTFRKGWYVKWDDLTPFHNLIK